MKNKMIICIVTVVLIVAAVVTAISFRSPKVSKTIDLDNQIYVQDLYSDTDGKKKYVIELKVPNDGKLSFCAYDASDTYDKTDEGKKTVVIIEDSDGKVVAENSSDNENYCMVVHSVKKGSYKVYITVKTKSTVDKIGLSWAYAEKEEGLVEIGGTTETAFTSENGEAKFKLVAERNELVEISGGDAISPEDFYTFYVTDKNGDKVVADTRIAETEWYKRKVYLTAGDYTITMVNLEKNSIAECTVKAVDGFGNITSQSFEKSTAAEIKKGIPASVGFTEIIKNTQWLKFTADGTSKNLTVKIDGNNTYYDYYSSAKLEIYDSQNKKIANESPESQYSYDISKLSGTYYISVTPAENNNMVVKVELS